MFVPKQPKYKPTRSTSLRDPSPALQKLGPESSTVQKNLEELAARSGKTAEADSPIVRPPKEEGESSCRRGHKKLAMFGNNPSNREERSIARERGEEIPGFFAVERTGGSKGEGASLQSHRPVLGPKRRRREKDPRFRIPEWMHPDVARDGDWPTIPSRPLTQEPNGGLLFSDQTCWQLFCTVL